MRCFELISSRMTHTHTTQGSRGTLEAWNKGCPRWFWADIAVAIIFPHGYNSNHLSTPPLLYKCHSKQPTGRNKGTIAQPLMTVRIFMDAWKYWIRFGLWEDNSVWVQNENAWSQHIRWKPSNSWAKPVSIMFVMYNEYHLMFTSISFTPDCPSITDYFETIFIQVATYSCSIPRRRSIHDRSLPLMLTHYANVDIEFSRRNAFCRHACIWKRASGLWHVVCWYMLLLALRVHPAGCSGLFAL